METGMGLHVLDAVLNSECAINALLDVSKSSKASQRQSMLKQLRVCDGISKRPAEAGRSTSVNDFNDAVCAGINQHRTIINDGVSVLGDAILTGDLIVGHAA